MTRLHALAAVSAALLLFASPVDAKEPKPRITEIQNHWIKRTTECRPGDTIFLRGTNLHVCPPPPEGDAEKKRKNRWSCAHPGVSATVNGKAARIMDAKPEFVQIHVPQATKYGKAKIKLEIKGRGQADASIDVVKELRKSDAAGEGGGVAAASGFRITAFRLLRGRNPKFEIEGASGDIPDKLRVKVSLICDDQEVETQQVKIEKREFKATFGPYTGRLLRGRYTAQVLFELSQQSRGQVRSFLRGLTKEEQNRYARLQKQEFVDTGTGPKGIVTPEDKEFERDRIRAHVVSFITAAERIVKDGRNAYLGAARSFFKAAGARSFEKDAYKKWLEKEEKLESQVVNRLLGDTTYATRTGHFKAEEYEKWVTQTQLPALEALEKMQKTFDGETIGSADPRVKEGGDELRSIAIELLKREGSSLYERSKMTVPSLIKNLRRPVSVSKVSRKEFDSVARNMKRMSGLLQ